MPAPTILLGVIGRPHGVRGLVHVTSHTADPVDLTAYGPLFDETGNRFALTWRGPGIVSVSRVIEGGAEPVTDRDGAARLTNSRLYVARDQLPPPDDDDFYIADLVGLLAEDPSGVSFGRVAAVHDYGAGASLEIECTNGTRLLVPFMHASVPLIDISAGWIQVNSPMEIALGAAERAA